MNILVLSYPYYEYLTATLVEGLTLLGHNVFGFTGDSRNYLQPHRGQSVDLFIQVNTEFGDIRLDPKIPKALVWAVDMYGPSDDLQKCPYSKFSFDAAFIRDYTGDGPANCFPINYGVERRYLDAMRDPLPPIADRNIDLIFTGSLAMTGSTYPAIGRRDKFVRAVLERFERRCNLVVGFPFTGSPDPFWSLWVNGRFHHDLEYFNALKDSKLVLCLHGAGPDTGRLWEAGVSGGVPVVQKYPTAMVDPQLETGENCLLFESVDELVEAAEWLLQNPDTAQKIAANARWFFARYHSSKSRAEYLLEKLTECRIVEQESSSAATECGEFDQAAERVRSLVSQWCNHGRRVIIYGAGQHTLQLAACTNLMDAPIVGIADSAPEKQGQELLGFRIVGPKQIESLNPDAVLISSRAFEDEICAELRYLKSLAIEVNRLYS